MLLGFRKHTSELAIFYENTYSVVPESSCFIGANKTLEQFGTVVHFLNSHEMWYTFKQEMLLDLDGERVRRKKKNVFMILMHLNSITNNFVQNCLKVTHVNSLSRITVRSSIWSSTKIRGNKIWWIKKKIKLCPFIDQQCCIKYSSNNVLNVLHV